MGKALKGCVIAFSGSFGPTNTPDKLKQWCRANYGDYASSLTKDTTHLVVSDKMWKQRPTMVATAMDRDDVHIVTYDWFDDSLREARKKPAKPYLWIQVEAQAQKKEMQKQKKEAKEAAKKEKESDKINYRTSLLEHTDAFGGAARQTTPGLSSAVMNSKAAAEFVKGAKSAKQDILSENHHIFRDETGFRYDVGLSKVNLASNKNERVNITIYESNGEPHTYATHVKFSGTKVQSNSATLAVLGSNWPTAFRVFRKAFHEHTGIEWEARIEAFEKRGKERSLTGEGSMGKAASAVKEDSGSSSVKNKEGSGKAASSGKKQAAEEKKQSAEEKKQRLEMEWKALPYTYRLPEAGQPRGTVPGRKEGNE